MIFDSVLVLVASYMKTFIDVIPIPSFEGAQWVAPIGVVLSYANGMDVVFPVVDTLACFTLVMSYMAVSYFYHFIMWIKRWIPFISG